MLLSFARWLRFNGFQVYKVPLMMGSNSGDGVLFGWVLAPWNKTCSCNSALPP
jgi:hypothetical protein